MDKKVIKHWTFFDWANSAYSLMITSAIFPMYYSGVTKNLILTIGGYKLLPTVVASYAISLSFLIIVLISPILSGIADYSHQKKKFMRTFTIIGSIACIAMFFFTRHNIYFGLTCSIIASIGYCGSLVFYNAFLPEIAPKVNQDEVSAKGFAMGYIGAVLLMVVCLAVIMLNDSKNWGWGDLPIRFSFMAVGLWWVGFGEYSLSGLPETKKKNNEKSNVTLFFKRGIETIFLVFEKIKQNQKIQSFLMSFFFYNMGVQTIMYMAVYFASEELGMDKNPTSLIITILLIQLVAIFGAKIFSKISTKKGNIFAITLILIIWIAVCFGAYITHTTNHFFILASFVGLVMGGIQSMSRSTYSKLIPEHELDHSSYFSFYDICDKTGTVLGTMSFGLLATVLGGLRNSILALMIYFILGLIILQFYHKKQYK